MLLPTEVRLVLRVNKVEERNGVIGIKINSLFDCLVWNGIF